MFREKINDLIEWKNSADRKPLIIRGARQVGKTWLMKEFGEKYYKKVAYINFDNNNIMKSLFEGDLSIENIVLGLRIESGVQIDTEDTLIIFDEFQEVPKALTSLKYFYENANEYHIIAAGSLLGVALHEGTSFPVGKVSFLDLYPLNFKEFLIATGNESLSELMEIGNWELVNTFSSKFIDLLKQYYFIGGMPEVVLSFIENSDLKKVSILQRKILDSYEQDFSKHAPISIVPRLRMLWNSIPSQLAKENKKFVYGLIREGARAREYEIALAWLTDCGLAHQVSRVTKPNMPLKSYQDFHAFKLFILDVGLLTCMLGLDSKTILEGNTIFTESKGTLTEQFVLQQLISNKDMYIYYWSAEKGTAELDFVLQTNGEIIPLEVKAEENLQAKSLKAYINKFTPKYAVRTSMTNYKEEANLINVPLSSIGEIDKILKQIN